MIEKKMIESKNDVKKPTPNAKRGAVYEQKDLFLPKSKVNYYIYQPARTLPPNAPFHAKIYNSLQLAYYKYQLATGLYMMNRRERAFINFIVLASMVLTAYHFILPLLM